MLQRLLRPLRRPPPQVAALPDGERVYAVGDVHGCADLLDELLAMIERDDRARAPLRTTIVFLGDLVDRGPRSAQVVDRLLRSSEAGGRLRFLMGNHEEIFLAALNGDAKALRLFSRIGGRETMMSYGLDAAAYERLDYDELAGCLQTLVPPAHRRFLQGFEDQIAIGDYLFVHAGIRPGRPLAEQRPADLRWIRDPFLQHVGPLAKKVVHGHTIADQVEERGHRIGIDTGAYATGVLSALGLEGTATWTIQTAPRATTHHREDGNSSTRPTG